MTKEVIVKFDVNEDQLAALRELLPKWQQYTSKEDGKKPFADWTEEKLLETLMYEGSLHEIWRKIETEQYRQGMITLDEMLAHREITVAQRNAERQQAQQKEGACE